MIHTKLKTDVSVAVFLASLANYLLICFMVYSVYIDLPNVHIVTKFTMIAFIVCVTQDQYGEFNLGKHSIYYTTLPEPKVL